VTELCAARVIRCGTPLTGHLDDGPAARSLCERGCSVGHVADVTSG